MRTHMAINDDGSLELMDLEDGCYLLNQQGSYTEATRFVSADWNRLYVTKVRLPDGAGNIVYLLTDTFENTFKLLDSHNFIVPPTYRKLFYPSVSYGMFMGKRYRLNLTKDRTRRFNLIKNNSRLIPYPGKKLTAGDRTNTFFSLADLFQATVKLCQAMPPKRITMEFFPQFGKIVDRMTPSWEAETKKPNDGNRIMIIDAETFAFKPAATLAENKLNPLFILYLAFFRTKDLSQLKYDQPILVTAKNMFMKFNPINLSRSGDFNRFKNALFRIMKSNLDEYTARLSDLEKQDLVVTAGDITVSNTVEAIVDSYTKYNSPAIKDAALSAVKDVARFEPPVPASQATPPQRQPSRLHNDLFRRVNGLDREPLFRDTDRTIPEPKVPVDRASTNVDKPSTTSEPTTPPPAPAARPFDRERLSQSVATDQARSMFTDTEDDLPADIDDDVLDILRDNDQVAEEINDAIQEEIMPLTNSKVTPVSSARDAKLREAQKKVVVKDATIEEILARDSSKVQIPIEDKSAMMTTTNETVKQVKFGNFDKVYQEQLLDRDIVACFDSLKDKPVPLYIKSIRVEDTSTVADLKDTWHIQLVDQFGKSQTVTVDIPKFYQNRFLIIERNRKVILKQNCFLPVIKDTPDTVIISSSNKKITVTRKSGKNMTLSQVARLFKLIAKLDDNDLFLPGDSTKINTNGSYVNSLEFDEIGRRLYRYTSGDTQLYFNRQYLKEMVEPKFTGKLNDDEFLIGYQGSIPIVINDGTGRDAQGRTICDIIEATLPPEAAKVMRGLKANKQSMFATAKMSGFELPVGVHLVIWYGLRHLMDILGVEWHFHRDVKRLAARSGYHQIRFANGIMEYRAELYAELILNGLSAIGPESFDFEDFETEKCYFEYLHKVVGTYTFAAQLMNFRDFFVDPITEEVCKDMQLPWQIDRLMVYAVELLCDNAHKSKVYDGFYRTRSSEIIPALLYQAVSKEYLHWVNSGQKVGYSLPQNCVIKALLALKTVENYSVINPAAEVGKLSTISAKGLAGSNMDRAYNSEEKRSYDPSSVGKIAMSSSPDANIGITRELVVEPMITNARGYREPITDETLEQLADVNLFSPVEMLTPGTAAGDDPIRVAMADKQTKHQVPVENASPALVSNGYDEAIQFHLSNDFVVNAEEDGEVVEFDEKTGMIMVRYTSGRCQAFGTKPEMVYNSSNGFYLSYTLKPTVKVGDKVKKDQVLAYHDKYFTYSKMNGLRYAIGPLVKIAFMSTYNTYEDAGICTEALSEKIKTSIVYKQDAPLTRNTDIISIVKVGDQVRVNDPLVRFEVVADDTSIANFIDKLPSDESKELVADLGKSSIVAEHSGTVVKIRVTSLAEPEELTTSLAEVVNRYWDENLSKEQLLNKYDDSPGVIKAGYLVTESTGVYKNRYGRIGHYKGKDVVIEIYIEHKFPAGVGDKVAIYGANKNIMGELIPKGYEPYSEFRPEEEVSVLTSPGTIARRMTPSVLPISMAMKCMVELKRRLKEIAKFQ